MLLCICSGSPYHYSGLRSDQPQCFCFYDLGLWWSLSSCCSVAQSCSSLCDPMGCSTPGFPVLHCFLEFAQIHVHWVSDAIQPSCLLSTFSSCPQSFPTSGSFQMSWLFTSRGQNIGVSASFLPINIQGWFPFRWIGWVSLQSKGPSRVFSSITVWKHQLFGPQPSLLCLVLVSSWPLGDGKNCRTKIPKN